MALLALAPACGFKGSGGGGSTGDDGGVVDAAPVCFGQMIPICFPAGAVPTTPRVLGTTDIDTDLMGVGSACDSNSDQQAKYCVVTGAGLALMPGAMLSAHGTKPLVLLSTTTIDLAGDIDVSSHHAGAQLRGAGANPTGAGACSFTTAPVAAAMGGGGYGGSFGTPGGNGGTSAVSATGKGIPGTALAGFPTTLRGGCRGGDGSAVDGSSGAGGDGGGAVALVAATQVKVGSSKINASGGGGHGGAMGPTAGGGGGGSGGMVVLDAPMLLFDPQSRLWANGGGGGQGSSPGAPAMTGADGGESTNPGGAAPGSSGAGTGGDGGLGSTSSIPGGFAFNAAGMGAGGGGGGGGGYVHAPGASNTGLISPPSSGP